MDSSLLLEIFRFRHKRPSADQSSATCAALAQRFSLFVGSCSTSDGLPSPPVPTFSHHELHELRLAAKRATTQPEAPRAGDAWVLEWLPSYGCALVASLSGVSRAALAVAYADGWQMKVHALPSGESVHSAVATTARELSCGALDPRKLGEFGRLFQQEKAEAQQRAGAARHASMGEDIGHQKTPAFVVAMAKRAMARAAKAPSRSIAAFGGTTDVGQHTGGQARDTCWPVVCAVLQTSLHDGGALWRKALTAFQLHLLQHSVSAVKEELSKQREPHIGEADKLHASVVQLCDTVDDLFAMLESVSRLGAALIDAGHDGSTLAKECIHIRRDIDELANRAGEWLDKAYTLPNAKGLKEWSESEEVVTLYTPTLSNSPNASSETNPLTNLGYGTFVDAAKCDFQGLNAWIDATRAASVPYSSIVILRAVERFMVCASAKLLTKQTWNHKNGRQMSV